MKWHGLELDDVPTANLMEAAAAIIEIDQQTAEKLYRLLGVEPTRNSSSVIAVALRERAALVRSGIIPGSLS